MGYDVRQGHSSHGGHVPEVSMLQSAGVLSSTWEARFLQKVQGPIFERLDAFVATQSAEYASRGTKLVGDEARHRDRRRLRFEELCELSSHFVRIALDECGLAIATRRTEKL